ncbi:hypothetical protein TELCIR_05431 [Teladorsagia circumcincta]|uniref:Peptidase S1 domain-containing protein n=1 Tax=Teladorsagia circumcincta TaxID=45464 RepID=A0A2G9USE3_TELCI|nr:hypothetical protein TELCIR_05431 [Teladorsagia circumcincta]
MKSSYSPVKREKDDKFDLLTGIKPDRTSIHLWQRLSFIFWGIPPEYFYIFVGAICTHPELCPQTSMFKAKEGDSGGPLIRTNEEGKHILVGITSSMKPHCEVSTERIYDRDNFFADVRAYVHWICEVTGRCVSRKAAERRIR